METMSKSAGQMVRFLCIGILNTAIDLAVLNALVLIFGVGRNGEWYVVFKSISFLAAVTNSYFFNRYWVFRPVQARTASALSSFFAVSVVGFFLNVAIASATFKILIGIYPGHTELIANLGAIVGTCVVLAWNFLGYKFFVFKA
jgi:putative flippase GtrA